MIHYPPALQAYVTSLRPKKKVILVLTKTDLVPRWLSEAWKTWFEEREGPDGASVVLMESYREIEKTELTQGMFLLHSVYIWSVVLTLGPASQAPTLVSLPPHPPQLDKPSSQPFVKLTTSFSNLPRLSRKILLASLAGVQSFGGTSIGTRCKTRRR